MPAKQRPDGDALTQARIVASLRQVGLPVDQYWVIMGAALVVHGVREYTSDIDLAVSRDLFGELVDSGLAVAISRSGRRKVLLKPRITAYDNWTPSSWCIRFGLPIATLNAVIEEKLILARPKDLKDVAEIRRQTNRGYSGEQL